jgi:DNA-binding LytR/AlgR family response regulator
MNCIIIDDELLAREELHSMLREISGPTVIGSFSHTLAAEKFLSEHKVDLVLLDIQMPKTTVLKFIEKIPKSSLVIFTTAYPQYALESYEFDAIDYLLKPFNNKRLQKAVDKAQHYSDLLVANKENSPERSTSVNFADIRYIEGLKDYVLFHTTWQKIIAAIIFKGVQAIQKELSILSIERLKAAKYVANIPLSLFLKTSKCQMNNMFTLRNLN